MSNPAFKHLSKKQLGRRVKIFTVLIYIAFTIAVGSYITFFIVDYKFDWSWLLIGLTYTLFPFNFITQIRRMKKEIEFREERARKRNWDKEEN